MKNSMYTTKQNHMMQMTNAKRDNVGKKNVMLTTYIALRNGKVRVKHDMI